MHHLLICASTSDATAVPATPPRKRQPSPPSAPGRFWELDLLRFIAILMMVVYHTAFDIAFTHGRGYFGAEGFWSWFQDATQGLFIGLVGVGMTLTSARAKPASRWRTFVPRAAHVFGFGLLLSGVMLIAGAGRIDFGVLHLIGVSLLVATPWLGHPWWAAASGVAIVAAGAWVQHVHVHTLAWVPVGIIPSPYVRLDFAPILPWLGVVLLGITAGSIWYPNGRRRWTPPDLSRWRTIRIATFLGRHSLIVYLVHQPIMYAILMATGFVSGAPQL